MGRVIILDTFPLSSTAKREPDPGIEPTLSDECHRWVRDCIRAGHRIIAPAIAYYEALRELNRLGAKNQAMRLNTFCKAVPDRYLSITDTHLEEAAALWAQARIAGAPTADAKALDVDVIRAAQGHSLQLPFSDYVVATTNVAHLSRFVPAELWSRITP